MKFSDYQDKCDKFWDDEVVKTYKQIMQSKNSQGATFFNNNDKAGFDIAVQKYCYAALIVLNVLNKHLPAFEDYEAVQSYFTDSLTQIQKDLKKFKMFRLDNNISDTINIVTSQMDAIKMEFFYKIENRSLYNLNNSDISYKPFNECADDTSETFFANESLTIGP